MLSYSRPSVTVEVVDNGAGGAAAKPYVVPDGHGIEGMRERASLHDGSLSAGPREGGGWIVNATVMDTTASDR